MDATAYLLERSGDILGAFKLIREVENHPHSFSHSLTPSLPHLPTHPIPHSLTLSLPSSPPQTLSKELEALSERYYRQDTPNTPDKGGKKRK